MLNSNYKLFRTYLPKPPLRPHWIIAKALSLVITDLAKDCYEGRDKNSETILANFFATVIASTGEPKLRRKIGYSYAKLVADWGKKRSSILAISTYYFLHSVEYGQKIAADIDKLLYAGKTFRQHHNKPVPGGYVDDNSSIIEIFDGPPSPQPTLNPASESGHDFHYSNAKFEVLGRVEEQKALRRFTSLEPGFQWLQLAGAGGQGKSRLANELILELQKEWAAGFLWKGDLDDFKPHWRTWQPSKPHLLVIDYVIGLEAEIGDAMGALARRSENLAFPVRMLLVERQRWDKGGLEWQNANHANGEIQLALSEGKADWFYKLNRSAGGKDLSKANIFEAGVIELTTLEPAYLVKIVRHIVEAEGKLVEQSDEFISTQLDKIDHSGRPLYAYFFARALIDGRFRPDWDKAKLLQHTLERDFDKRWSSERSTTPTLDSGHPAISFALLATIIRSLDKTELSLQSWQGLDASSWRQALLVSDTPAQGGLMGPGDVISGLEPDILGEWFVLTALQKSASLLEPIASAAWAMRPAQMAAFLLRTVQDFPTHISTLKLLEFEPSNDAGKAAYATIAIAVLTELERAGQSLPATTLLAIHRAAETGDGAAMNWLGAYHHYCRGPERDLGKAIEWYLRGAEAGNGRAMNGLGVCHYYGMGVPTDFAQAYHWYAKGAEAGDGQAMNGLGICYRHGHGTTQDFDKAYYWYSQSAALGAGLAMNGLALCYSHGHGVPQDHAKAFYWYSQAAAIGEARAMNGLAICHYKGDGVPQNYDEAFRWYSKAAAANDELAMNGLGICYYHGHGVQKDHAFAFQWYEKAAAAGSDNGMNGLGICYYNGHGVQQDYALAFECYEKAAAAGNDNAMNGLANCYFNGHGVEQNFQAAISWLSKSADLGNIDAAMHLAERFYNGNGLDQNFDKAFRYYTLGAEAGNAAAMNGVGICYHHGHGVDQSYSDAFKWYTAAADGGNMHGMYNLGICYHGGRGVAQDLEGAFEWYRRAAELEHNHALGAVADCYFYGRGVEQNFAQAFKWYIAAAEAGNVIAMSNVGLCYQHGKGIDPNMVKAFEAYYKAATGGNLIAMKEVADCYFLGRGVEQDYVAAFGWYLKGAEAGNPPAMTAVGACYFNGYGVDQNYSNSSVWYEKAANAGDVGAFLNLGILYSSLDDSEENLTQAFKWYKMAADAGNVTAMFLVGALYEDGAVVEQDNFEAIRWYQKSIDGGFDKGIATEAINRLQPPGTQ